MKIGFRKSKRLLNRPNSPHWSNHESTDFLWSQARCDLAVQVKPKFCLAHFHGCERTVKPETAPTPYRGVSDPLRYNLYHGGLAELADAEVSKTSESNLISVRFRYPPPSCVFP